jgi:hypothetical protein
MFVNKNKNFILSSHRLNNINSFTEEISFCTYWIYYNKNLNVSFPSQNCIIFGSCFFVGKIGEVTRDSKIEDLNYFQNIEDAFNFFESSFGRYIVLLNIKDNLIVFGDPFMSKNLFVNFSSQVASTSLDFFYEVTGDKLNNDESYNSWISKPKSIQSEWFVPTDKSFDKRFKRLLPNRYWILGEKTFKRIPLKLKPGKPEDSVKEIDQIFKASYQILKGKNLIQPLTKGWDSRLLFSYSHSYPLINYYLFDYGNKLSLLDGESALKIANLFNVSFNIYKLDEATDKFLNYFSAKFSKPRILRKTSNIEFHFKNSQNQKFNLNGNGGEILRDFYNSKGKSYDFESFVKKIRFSNEDDFILEFLGQWFNSVPPTLEKVILDLFYWEVKMGIWGSMFPCEQEDAIEEISIFNNRKLMLLGLSLPHSYRAFPNNKLFKILIRKNAPKQMVIEFYSISQKIKNFLKSIIN